MERIIAPINGYFMEQDDGGTVFFLGFLIVAALVVMALLTEFLSVSSGKERSTR